MFEEMNLQHAMNLRQRLFHAIVVIIILKKELLIRLYFKINPIKLIGVMKKFVKCVFMLLEIEILQDLIDIIFIKVF